MDIEFELDSIKHSPEDVLKYLFNEGENVTADFVNDIVYFKRVNDFISNVLRLSSVLRQVKTLSSTETLTLENEARRKRIFNTIVLMMHLPLSLKYSSEISSYKIDESIDYDSKNPQSVLYTAVLNVESFIARIPPSFFNEPASTKYHGAFAGGLMYHSIAVLKAVLDTYDIYLSEKYRKLSNTSNIYVEMREDICANIAAILLHDICKVGKYTYNADKNKYDYNYNAVPSFQHGAESYRRLVHEGFHLSREWELAVAYHMGNWGVSETESKDFSTITEKIPEVLLLHHADMIATKIYHI